MPKKASGFFENFIVFAIILVLVQTFLEDFAVLAGWSWDLRKTLVISGFVFDVIFTIEFYARSFYAISKGRFTQYFTEERGWIDFLASVPLLLFNSGPELFALVTGSGAALAFGGLLNVLKVVKAIRIARVLRLLRVLKIFRRIKNAESVMAQRHVARIATMVVSTLVFALLLVAVVEGLGDIQNTEDMYGRTAVALTNYLEEQQLADSNAQGQLASYAQSFPLLLQVRQDGHIRFDRSQDMDLAPSDYGYINQDGIELYLDVRNLNVDASAANLRYFVLIIAIVLMLMFLYSPHFALTISDPIHIMRKGFDEKGYNLEVRIPEMYKDDEVYRLANSYNQLYLPMKDRAGLEDGNSVLNLSADDFADFQSPMSDEVDAFYSNQAEHFTEDQGKEHSADEHMDSEDEEFFDQLIPNEEPIFDDIRAGSDIPDAADHDEQNSLSGVDHSESETDDFDISLDDDVFGEDDTPVESEELIGVADLEIGDEEDMEDFSFDDLPDLDDLDDEDPLS